MDKTFWKPKIFKAEEIVDYKANEGIEQFNLKETVGLYEVSTVMLPTAFNDLKMYETMIIKMVNLWNIKKHIVPKKKQELVIKKQL